MSIDHECVVDSSTIDDCSISIRLSFSCGLIFDGLSSRLKWEEKDNRDGRNTSHSHSHI
jgi:hypothetical protein